MKEYWEILRELREDRDIKQATVARVLGTTQQVYSRYENGINEMPIRHLRTLCRYYGVSADYLLGRTDADTGGRGTSELRELVEELRALTARAEKRIEDL